jgi:sirohydrochlorin cobaltochelatase
MRRTSSLITALLILAPAAASAQHEHHGPVTAPRREAVAVPAVAGPVGTLIVAHGGGPEWDAQVLHVAGLVKTGGPVEVSFLMGPGAAGARFQDMAARLVEAGATQIVVVPLLVSSHSGHYEQIRYLAGDVETLDETMMHHLHMSGIERPSLTVPIRVAKAIDDAPHAARVITERALAMATTPKTQALFIVGHGPNSAEDNAEWMRNLRVVADSVRNASGFRDVKIGLVRDDAPAAVRAEAVQWVRDVIRLQHELTGEPVVVVPVLISKGRVSQEKIPADLAGLPIVYTGNALLPHPEMARWVETRVHSTAVVAKR